MMMDPRYTRLAKVLLDFSTCIKKGEKILIDAHNVPDAMVIALVTGARERGACPFVNIQRAAINRALFQKGASAQFEVMCAYELARMKHMDAYISLRGADNIFEMSDVPADQMKSAMKALRPVLNWRVRKTRWVVLRWPTFGMAQQALSSTEAFEKFFFDVCTQDYSRMIPGMKALKRLMDKTDQVRITGPDTDLTFSIKGIGAVACGGTHNIPDGEVFTAPVRNSIEGTVAFNIPTIYQGVSFETVRLVFKKGRIVEASAGAKAVTRRLNEILDSDAGARFTGEFALGFNPYILEPMRDILFDEKIAGSFHLTPGQAYDQADNGNRSQIHWDMVCIQRPEYGGGAIYFDDQLIRKNGLFIPKALQKLNPDFLKKRGK